MLRSSKDSTLVRHIPAERVRAVEVDDIALSYM
jgi:hypothetical protein